MKEKKVSIVLFVFVIVFMLSSCNPENQMILFKCPVLEQAVRNAAGYTGEPTGPIYPSDVLGIIRLDVSNESTTQRENVNMNEGVCEWDEKDIFLKETKPTVSKNSRVVMTSIAGIEYLKNLEDLDFGYNNVSDLSPLENLVKLEILYFRSNNISDLSPLENLTSLKSLHFLGNNVSDLSPLENLTNLQVLICGYNNISDLSSLENLTNLDVLHFSDNSVSDLSPLANLTKLEDLYFWDNNISNINALTNLVNLEYLHFYRNNVSNLSPLENLTNLVELFFLSNSVSDIQPLVNNTGLDDGDVIQMQNNNLELSPSSQNMIDINTLIDRGVDVTYEPQN